MFDSLCKVVPKNLPGCFMVFSLAILATFVVAAPIAQARSGSAGWTAVVVAASVCWIAGTTALVAAAVSRRSTFAQSALLLGILLRMALPLAAGLMLYRLGGALAHAGVFGWIVVFYLVSLVVETLLSLRLLNAARAQKLG